MLNKIIETLHASAELLDEEELIDLKDKLLTNHLNKSYQEIEKQHTINCNVIDKELKAIVSDKEKNQQLASAVCLNRQHCGNYKGGQMATKTAEGKLVIPDNVYEAISNVRDSGVINMASFNQLLELVPSDVSSWLQDNKEIYMEGFFYGFVPESQNT